MSGKSELLAVDGAAARAVRAGHYWMLMSLAGMDVDFPEAQEQITGRAEAQVIGSFRGHSLEDFARLRGRCGRAGALPACCAGPMPDAVRTNTRA